MTINKLQGQTILYVGIYLLESIHVLTWTSLCWFIKRVLRSTTRVLAKPIEDLDPRGKSIKNFVYKNILN
jgi:ATP-dependent DNA helicase PIF1